MAEPALPSGGMTALMGRMDPTAQELIDSDVPMTPENYLDARFDGDVPEDWQHESQMGLPPELQGFSGVGLSETPQGPLPIPEGPMDQGVRPEMAKGQAPPELVGPKARAQSPLSQTGPSGAGQFRQSVGFKPQAPQGGGG